LDIDDFKHINDQYGHDLGDQVLIQLVLNVKSILSENQNVGRMGGEEFLITMPYTSAEDAKLQAEKIRLAIAESTIIHQHSAVKFSVSIGVIAKKDHKSSFEKMVKQADLALYSAKSSGKNQVNLYGAM
jgi:diguanylate cyclase (GGDEF)-like protein